MPGPFDSQIAGGFLGSLKQAGQAVGHDMMNHYRLGSGGNAMDMFNNKLPDGKLGTGLSLSDVAGIFKGQIPTQGLMRPQAVPAPTQFDPTMVPAGAPNPQLPPMPPQVVGLDINSIIKLMSTLGIGA